MGSKKKPRQQQQQEEGGGKRGGGGLDKKRDKDDASPVVVAPTTAARPRNEEQQQQKKMTLDGSVSGKEAERMDCWEPYDFDLFISAQFDRARTPRLFHVAKHIADAFQAKQKRVFVCCHRQAAQLAASALPRSKFAVILATAEYGSPLAQKLSDNRDHDSDQGGPSSPKDKDGEGEDADGEGTHMSAFEPSSFFNRSPARVCDDGFEVHRMVPYMHAADVTATDMLMEAQHLLKRGRACTFVVKMCPSFSHEHTASLLRDAVVDYTWATFEREEDMVLQDFDDVPGREVVPGGLVRALFDKYDAYSSVLERKTSRSKEPEAAARVQTPSGGEGLSVHHVLASAFSKLEDDEFFDVAYLPLWGLTSAALSSINLLSAFTCISHFDVSANSIGDDGAALIVDALSNSSISVTVKHLSVAHNGIGSAGASRIAAYIGSAACQLTSLNMSRNHLGADGTRGFGAALLTTKSLQALDLSFTGMNVCNGSEDMCSAALGAFADGLQNCVTLKSLNLEGNSLDSAAAKRIAPVLRHNTTLRSLNLGKNKLEKKGLTKILAYAAENRTLKVLRLHENSTEMINDVRFLLLFLLGNASVRVLSLAGNKITYGHSRGGQMPFTVQWLNFARNYLGTGGFLNFMSSFYGNEAFDLLNLEDNEILILGQEVVALRKISRVVLVGNPIQWPPLEGSDLFLNPDSKLYSLIPKHTFGFEVHALPRIVLLGDSGAGKTTLRTCLRLSTKPNQWITQPFTLKQHIATVKEGFIRLSPDEVAEWLLRTTHHAEGAKSQKEDVAAAAAAAAALLMQPSARLSGKAFLSLTRAELISVYEEAFLAATRAESREGRCAASEEKHLGAKRFEDNEATELRRFSLYDAVRPSETITVHPGLGGECAALIRAAVDAHWILTDAHLDEKAERATEQSVFFHLSLMLARLKFDDSRFKHLTALPHVRTEGLQLDVWNEVACAIWDFSGLMSHYASLSDILYCDDPFVVVVIDLREGAAKNLDSLRHWLNLVDACNPLCEVSGAMRARKIPVRIFGSFGDVVYGDLVEDLASLFKTIQQEFGASFDFGPNNKIYAPRYAMEAAYCLPSFLVDIIKFRDGIAALRGYSADDLVTPRRCHLMHVEHPEWPVVSQEKVFYGFSRRTEDKQHMRQLLGSFKFARFSKGSSRVLCEPLPWLNKIASLLFHPTRGLRSLPITHSFGGVPAWTANEVCRVLNHGGRVVVDPHHAEELMEFLLQDHLCVPVDATPCEEASKEPITQLTEVTTAPATAQGSSSSNSNKKKASPSRATPARAYAFPALMPDIIPPTFSNQLGSNARIIGRRYTPHWDSKTQAPYTLFPFMCTELQALVRAEGKTLVVGRNVFVAQIKGFLLFMTIEGRPQKASTTTNACATTKAGALPSPQQQQHEQVASSSSRSSSDDQSKREPSSAPSPSSVHVEVGEEDEGALSAIDFFVASQEKAGKKTNQAQKKVLDAVTFCFARVVQRYFPRRTMEKYAIFCHATGKAGEMLQDFSASFIPARGSRLARNPVLALKDGVRQHVRHTLFGEVSLLYLYTKPKDEVASNSGKRNSDGSTSFKSGGPRVQPSATGFNAPLDRYIWEQWLRFDPHKGDPRREYLEEELIKIRPYTTMLTDHRFVTEKRLKAPIPASSSQAKGTTKSKATVSAKRAAKRSSATADELE